ncbi:MAG: succinate dehydrogenase, hydrophobic membrane anchor protein [Gammaproteobacteria bacterium]|nr:succinate dehydrogenase, hydrophobic membrane anchor protein [Gammaproteobacteria bacterium]
MNANAQKGAHHWLWQRATAVALAVLSVWFVFEILGRVDDAHGAAMAWVAHPGVAAALIIYLVALFWHAQLGLQVIAEDYIASDGARRKSVRAFAAINTLAALAAIAAVARIAFFQTP